jgi:signal peptidase I
MPFESLPGARSALNADRYADAALDLLHRSLAAGETVRLPVSGTSMLPLLQPGNTVTVIPADPAALRRGDLVVAWQHDRLLIHRLVAIDARGWHTKGDNNDLADPPLAGQAILGRIVTIERYGTLIRMQRRRWQVVHPVLGALSHLETRVVTQRHQSRLLRYIAVAPFRLVFQTLVAIAMRG